jgi:GDPmannose 4,6-dehydratase
MNKALITGVTGQDGAYLSQLLISKGYEVIGLTRNRLQLNTKNLQYLGIADRVSIRELDLLDLHEVCRFLEAHQPHEVYNLGAQSSVKRSFQDPLKTLQYNLLSVSNLLEGIRLTNKGIRFYQASSSEMFGNIHPDKLPIQEDLLFHPVSPYAVSKAAAHWTSVNYREAYGLHASCGVLFNHESSLRGEEFVTKKIVTTAVKIKMGLPGAFELRLGNLNVSRDFGYAPDYVEAMWRMLQKDSASDYIICSGIPFSLSAFVEDVFQCLSLEADHYVKIDPTLLLPVDLEIVYRDNSKARKHLD